MRTPAVALILAAILASETFAGRGVPSVEPSFTPVPPVRPSVRPVDPGADRVIVDVGLGVRPMPSRPVVRTPRNNPIVLRLSGEGDGAQSVAGSGAESDLGRVDRGVASWYCGNGSPCTRGYPGGLYAAAGPALRVGDWRGRVVLVSANGQSVRVRLIDWCACPNGRVLDLYADAFRRLAPLSQGLVKVTVR